MNKRYIQWSIAMWLLLLFQPLSAQETTLTDQVSILPLDQPLHARSQLGGVTVDRLGFIYVSNFHDAVWKISPQGKVTLLSDGMYGSSGNTLDARGNLYQANFFSNTIVKIDRFGEVTTFVENGLNGPVGMVFDGENNLYVCNFNDNNILRITPEKDISVFAKGDLFNGPNGITIDGEGNIMVVNFNSNQVIKISPEGTPSVFAEVKGTDGNAHLVYYNDQFFLTKIKSNRVYRINKKGEVKLLAGTGKTAITPGPAPSASFSAPNGIGVDATTGVLYVNNVNGQWTSKEPTTIDLSKIELLTLSQMMSHHIDNNDLDAAKAAFWAYHNDSFHADENLGPATGTLGWQYMAKRNVSASILLFSLLSEAYPDRWRPWYYLGETYKIIGQPDQAKEFYEKALAKDPDNKSVLARLKEL